MRFKINCASSYYGVDGLLRRYDKILKGFNLEVEPHDEYTMYDVNAWVEINSLDDLMKLSKKTSRLVIDSREMEIIIYDDYME